MADTFDTSDGFQFMSGLVEAIRANERAERALADLRADPATRHVRAKFQREEQRRAARRGLMGRRRRVGGCDHG